MAFCLFGSSIAATNNAATNSKPPLAYTVFCDDPVLAKQLESGISARLAKAHIEVSDKAPWARLMLYVMKDVNSNKNTAGITIAIAHVSNVPVLALAADTINVKKEKPSPLLIRMFREEGFIHHLSAAHLDDASARQVNIMLDSVVATFIQKSLPSDN
jgi:hypothetical protein